MNSRIILGCAIGLAAICIAVPAQTPPTNPGSPNPSIPGASTPRQPTLPDANAPQIPDIKRPLFISGKVTMEDGTPPPDSVVIQLVCRANPRSVGYTDPKGGFSFDLNNPLTGTMVMDASQSGYDSAANDPFDGGAPQRTLVSSGSQRSNVDPFNDRSLTGCDLQASLPGFRSDVLHMTSRRSMDNPDIGTIILHRLSNVEGLTISATSALAPKDAKKAYEKAREQAHKGKWADAEKSLEKAVAQYPKYAAAWFQLGLIQQNQKDFDGARKSYAQALEADPKFVSPYLQLALIAAGDKKWQEVADNTNRLVQLNPVDFPQAWLFNSLANYYMNKFDAAEKSAREGISHDSVHKYPKMNQVLGVVLAQRQDYSGAAEQLRDYLKFAGEKASDVDQVKKQLEQLEKFTAPQEKK